VLKGNLIIAILCVTVLALAGCGGGGDKSGGDKGKTTAQTPTPTATATATATATPKPEPPPCKDVEVKGIDVCKVGAARDRFVVLCAKRQAKPKTRDDKSDLTDLRKATTTLLRAFRANPDEKWRRAKNLPKLALRTRLLALGYVARKRCGGGDAVKLGQRITRTLVKTPVEKS
jgi:hypothetical protein